MFDRLTRNTIANVKNHYAVIRVMIYCMNQAANIGKKS